jgi:hypothetical protein
MKKSKRGGAQMKDWLTNAAGTLFIYLILMLVLTFLLERQPSSFIYVSF